MYTFFVRSDLMKSYMQAVVDYVEDHIHESITMDDIEAYIGYSRYYLHRVFSVFLGLTIMDYIRIRKMQYARADLVKDSTILEIALDYGYRSERSFRRAFKMVYQDAPSKLRKEDFSLPEKIVLDKVGGIKMLPYLSDVKEVRLKEYYAVGYQTVGKEPEGEVIDYMTNYKFEKKLHPISEIGSDVPVTSEESDQGFRGYVQYLVLKQDEYDQIEDANLLKKEVEASKYIMLTIDEPFKDPMERIPNGFKKLIDYLEKHHTYNDQLAISSFEEEVETMRGTKMHIYIAVKG